MAPFCLSKDINLIYVRRYAVEKIYNFNYVDFVTKMITDISFYTELISNLTWAQNVLFIKILGVFTLQKKKM